VDGPLGEKGRLTRPKARESVAPDRPNVGYQRLVGQNVGVQEMIEWLILAGIVALTAAISFLERSKDVNA